MFSVEPSPIAGCVAIQGRAHRDDRGVFVKTYHSEYFAELNIRDHFVEQYYSFNQRGVLRGMHFQTPPHHHAKIVHCVQGALLDVILDLRPGPGYGRTASFDLRAGDARFVYVPKGCAHGFLSLADETIMTYMVSTVYAPEHDTGVLWNSFGFAWPQEVCEAGGPALSPRDQGFVPFDAFQTPFADEHASS